MRTAKRQTPAHVTMASLLIGMMAAGLVVVLDTAGFWEAWDTAANAWMEKLGDGLREVPRRWVVMHVILSTYLLPAVLLRTPGWWRRVILWVSFVLVNMMWWPVLALCAWKIDPCLPLVAMLWSGFCAMIYAQRHRLPCDQEMREASAEETPAAS